MKTNTSIFGGLLSALGFNDGKPTRAGINPAVALLHTDDLMLYYNYQKDLAVLQQEERNFERFSRLNKNISPAEKRALVIYVGVLAKFRREWPVRQLTARRVIKNYPGSISYTFEVYCVNNTMLQRVSFTTSK